MIIAHKRLNDTAGFYCIITIVSIHKTDICSGTVIFIVFNGSVVSYCLYNIAIWVNSTYCNILGDHTTCRCCCVFVPLFISLCIGLAGSCILFPVIRMLLIIIQINLKHLRELCPPSLLIIVCMIEKIIQSFYKFSIRTCCHVPCPA